MADYYSTTNAYSRSNANTSSNDNIGGGGYYNSNVNHNYNPYANANTDNNNTNTNSNNNSNNNTGQQQPQQQHHSNAAAASMFTNFATAAATAAMSTNPNTNTNTLGGNGGGAMPSLWNPVMTAAIQNKDNHDAISKMAVQVGSKFLDEGTARLIPGLETFMKTLRVYFAVDNGYVKRKMCRVLFSFFYKNWSRSLAQSNPNPSQQSTTPSSVSYALPIHDDNAPDLYIPFMSLITYVLLCALCYGTAGQFDPDVIMNVTMKCIMIQLLEIAVFKTGLYVIGGSKTNTSGNNNNNEERGVAFLDLFSFTGYKYLGLICNIIIGYTTSIMIGNFNNSIISNDNNDNDAASAAAVTTSTSNGQKGYYIMYLWTASSICYFMLKTMANHVKKQNGSSATDATTTSSYYEQYQQPSSQKSSAAREFVILGFALSQFVTLWFLGQTKFI